MSNELRPPIYICGAVFVDMNGREVVFAFVAYAGPAQVSVVSIVIEGCYDQIRK